MEHKLYLNSINYFIIKINYDTNSDDE